MAGKRQHLTDEDRHCKELQADPSDPPRCLKIAGGLAIAIWSDSEDG